ncbi:hypothetical protein GVAV_000028 [Gurleya vavrai]
MTCDLEKNIINSLKVPFFETENELKNHLKNTRDMIANYELFLYEIEAYDDEEIEKITKWRRTLAINANTVKNSILKNVKEQFNSKSANRDDINDLEETVRLVSREINKADQNISILQKSTIKLKGINYTSKDLEKEIEETRRMIQKDKNMERKEILRIKMAICIFIFVCFAIFVDIIRSKSFWL